MQKTILQYQVGATTVELESRPGVFAPSAHGLYFARTIQFQPHTQVLDIGTGSGILAVTAALQGAQVTATDVVEASLELTTANAIRNGVEVQTRQGPFFTGVTGTFDQIVANLPQEIVLSDDTPVNPDEAIAIDGGERGNHLVIALLEQAPKYMHSKSELWLPLHTLSDYQDTLRAALSHFNVRIHAIGDLPVKPFVTKHLDIYKQLSEQGVIRIFQRDEQWFSQVWVIALSLR
ncbi:MAG: class I SAM-dependent methyltransferase [Aliidiomarina sp.]|uniref:class I SAM-dependent methyltransferase n=1 Tax=Aliidiomarina sp. TaxID=1872439 RepID=UPI0025C0BD89|nr:class I SAM-dependent methyltransferase [Aliidiomarina sp.]MCH8501162.1 class I SAM-dependent methyltransferase [Aliidiomarina sp.]